jgi:hypothetical protein
MELDRVVVAMDASCNVHVSSRPDEHEAFRLRVTNQKSCGEKDNPSLCDEHDVLKIEVPKDAWLAMCRSFIEEAKP